MTQILRNNVITGWVLIALEVGVRFGELVMSTKYKDPKEVPTTVLVARLKELADAVASGNFSELRMRIPAEVDSDADIVLTEVAKRLEAANDICVFTGKPINEVLDDIGREVAAESRQNYDFYGGDLEDELACS